jgi:predicted HAD superfamily Cof-like phosphohydrolase
LTQYLKDGAFHVQMGGDQKYRDNWDAIFSKPPTEHDADRLLDDLDKIYNPVNGVGTPVDTWIPLVEIEGSIQHDVREFHRVYGQPIRETPGVPPAERVDLRIALIAEEFLEFLAATGMPGSEVEFIGGMIEEGRKRRTSSFDLVEVADALADMAYVIEGACLEFGIDSEKVLEEVQRSNMSKLGDDGKPVYNESGKVIKGPNYSPPNIAKVLGCE